MRPNELHPGPCLSLPPHPVPAANQAVSPIEAGALGGHWGNDGQDGAFRVTLAGLNEAIHQTVLNLCSIFGSDCLWFPKNKYFS